MQQTDITAFYSHISGNLVALLRVTCVSKYKGEALKPTVPT